MTLNTDEIWVEVFLLWGLMMAGIICGFIFFIIPGYVITIAWALSLPLLVERGINPLEAMTFSNKLTYGKKWTIFLGVLVVYLAIIIPTIILAYAANLIFASLGILIFLLGYILLISVVIAVIAYIYGELTKETS